MFGFCFFTPSSPCVLGPGGFSPSLCCCPGALFSSLTSPPRPGTPCPRTALLGISHLPAPQGPSPVSSACALRTLSFPHSLPWGTHVLSNSLLLGTALFSLSCAQDPSPCRSEPGPHPPRPALPSEDRGRGVGWTPERRTHGPAAPCLQQNCLCRTARPVRKYRSGRGPGCNHHRRCGRRGQVPGASGLCSVFCPALSD